MADVPKGPWLMLMGEQKLPIEGEQWLPYAPEISVLLCEALAAQSEVQASDADTKLLDMSMFTTPPLPYCIYRGRVVTVRSPLAPAHLQGKRTVGGWPAEIWDEACKNTELLPSSVRGLGVPVPYFFQVHQDCLADMEQLEACYADPTGSIPLPAANPRRRAVMFVKIASHFDDTRRFARKRESRSQPSGAVGAEEQVAAVSVLEQGGEHLSAIYEWWAGPAPPQHEVESPPLGRWKMYHPKVCRKLEAVYQESEAFRTGTEPTDVDGVRYMMQRISAERPFDYLGKASREEFTEPYKITVEHKCYSESDRAFEHCFVQFQKGNPKRRRPARRVADAAEVAKRAIKKGTPCCICYSEDGQLTGCNRAHVICTGCLRGGLRSMAGDALVIEHLLCGCFNMDTRRALLALAEHADVSLQDTIKQPPTDSFEVQDFEMEVRTTRAQFDLGEGPIPDDLYRQKVQEWFRKVHINDRAPLYHPCSHPDCASLIDNWILKEDFERDFQSQGVTKWFCNAGHENLVLPTQEEIDMMNKNILMHPRFYTMMADYDNCPLRLYRFCAECVRGGVLMLAMHGGACKQWPGYGRGHQHCFCFKCSRRWGSECTHQSTDCVDPGLQQVVVVGDKLEIGFVEADAYLRWLGGQDAKAPPTCYPAGQTFEDGDARQKRLGMTDRQQLIEEMRDSGNGEPEPQPRPQ